MKNKILKAAVILTVMGPMSVLAMPTLLVDGMGQLTGATGVYVGGVSYDVAFADGTCSELFDDCDEISDFTFQTAADAGLASQALLDSVFIDGVAGNFDSDQSLTIGCEPFGSFCYSFTPYEPGMTPGQVNVYGAFNHPSESQDGIVPVSGYPALFDTMLDGGATWAIWSPIPMDNEIPEPGTLALLGFGLAGMGFARRKKA